MHGVTGKFAQSNAAKRGRPKGKIGPPKKAAAPEAATPLGAFEAVCKMVGLHMEIVDGCLEGLGMLLAKAKVLRHSYIKSADKLRKLQVEIASMSDKEDADLRR